jgi:hypothetical protein
VRASAKSEFLSKAADCLKPEGVLFQKYKKYGFLPMEDVKSKKNKLPGKDLQNEELKKYA